MTLCSYYLPVQVKNEFKLNLFICLASQMVHDGKCNNKKFIKRMKKRNTLISYRSSPAIGIKLRYFTFLLYFKLNLILILIS